MPRFLPNSYNKSASLSDAPPIIAPAFKHAAINTDVFNSIIRIYICSDTIESVKSACSKSISYCCPSHTSRAVTLSRLNNFGICSCVSSKNVYARIITASPERIAVFVFHFT